MKRDCFMHYVTADVHGCYDKYRAMLETIPQGCEEMTWLELLTVKHTFLIARQMAEQGDVVSELTDAASPSSIGGEGEK